MRLWHQDLIKELPRNQLLGQHRECCALRGKGWGKKHSTVDYVFQYSPYYLYEYHLLVMKEMTKRGYNVSQEWWNKNYRGKRLLAYNNLEVEDTKCPIYPEHNANYLRDCLVNLSEKGVQLSNY